MKKRTKLGYLLLVLFMVMCIFSTQVNSNKLIEPNQQYFLNENPNLRTSGFWNNFTYIHITNLNWTDANKTEWCSGSGTFTNPYRIENMIINATNSPIGCGILIENSINAYFIIENITIFGGSNGIELENTNNGALIGNVLLNNLDSGIGMINSDNNTLLANMVFNNGLCGINLTSYCYGNRIFENIAKNEGSNLQDTGIHLRNYCNNNEILGNLIYDNNVNGINIENYCKGNVISNNSITNIATSQQDYGIRLHNDCDENIISSNIIEDLNNFGIYMVTSDHNSIIENQIIDCSNGMYMLIDRQSIITGNTISGGSYGIIMSACDEGNINSNFINETTNYAIRIYINSDNNEFYDNVIKDNINLGIQLDDPSDTNNKFYGNSFISNGIHAFDNGTSTTWNNSITGNYWDDYTGLDENDDGIGDTPYISGNITDYLPIWEDGDDLPPTIKIISPLENELFQADPPSFNVEISDANLDKMWYTLNLDSTKYFFTDNGSLIGWSGLSDGAVTITFFANDSAGNEFSDSINVIKDTVAPIVNIISPIDGEFLNATTPNFNVEISDANLDKMWYTLNLDSTKYFFTDNGSLMVWSSLSDGAVTITFFANDSAGNEFSESINIMKNTQNQGGGPDPNNGGIITIIIISSIVLSTIILPGILIRRSRTKKPGLPKEFKILNEEQLAQAQYFKDVTSILIIIAIHKDSGLALSKIALHEGNGLDEDLFTGFISAMGSFKNELAKQMGLRVREEGGDNIIQYNEFTITVMDGEFLRLGLVSYSNLGPSIKQQCAQVLRDYEVKHMDKLKNFDGGILSFKDFEETIERGLNMNLNKKCHINVKQLNKYDASVPLRTVLHEFNLSSEGFYLIEVSSALIQQYSIPEEEAYFMVSEAFNQGVFIPINKI